MVCDKVVCERWCVTKRRRRRRRRWRRRRRGGGGGDGGGGGGAGIQNQKQEPHAKMRGTKDKAQEQIRTTKQSVLCPCRIRTRFGEIIPTGPGTSILMSSKFHHSRAGKDTMHSMRSREASPCESQRSLDAAGRSKIEPLKQVS